MKTLLALASAAALAASFAVPAQAGGSYHQPKGSYTNNVNVKQNGNGCRNRCYGTQTFNAGVNNGNTNGNAYGHVNNVNVKQNGNGCRNRCYGTQTFNAGVNNGNGAKKYGH